jgi:uncharacterized membrane protein
VFDLLSRSEKLTLIRNLALRILNAVVRRTPPDVRDWGLAMLREMDFIENDRAALFWAIGSVKALASSRKGKETMRVQLINRVSSRALIFLSLVALLAVLSGYFQASQPDEGTAAHIFQLSIVALVPMVLLFLATVDWKKPLRSTRVLGIPASALVLAFGALYYLEHYR